MKPRFRILWIKFEGVSHYISPVWSPLGDYNQYQAACKIGGRIIRENGELLSYDARAGHKELWKNKNSPRLI